LSYTRVGPLAGRAAGASLAVRRARWRQGERTTGHT